MRVLAVVAVLMLGGCAALGPVGSPEYAALVASSVPADAGAPVLSSGGYWTPNRRDTPRRNWALGGAAEGAPGVITITESAVVFSQWDDARGRFVPMRRIDFANIIDVSTPQYGAWRGLAIQQRDLTFDLFEFTDSQGQMINRQRASDAADLIRARL